MWWGAPARLAGRWLKAEEPLSVVCSKSLMASLTRSVGGLSKYFCQGLWLTDLNADVVGQSINKHGVAQDFPHHVTVSSSFSARFLYGFPYRFQRAWTVLCSLKHPLDVVRVRAWNSILFPARLMCTPQAWGINGQEIRWASGSSGLWTY